MLQETHIKDENLIKLYWKHDFVSSCVSTQSAGVIILFDNSFACIDTFKDSAGGLAMAVI